MRRTMIATVLGILPLLVSGIPTSPTGDPIVASHTEGPTGRDRIVVHAVGDVAWCNCFHDAFDRLGYDVAFQRMNGIFQRDALTIANLECAASPLGTRLSPKPQSIRCDVDALPVLAEHGIDVAALGNNHAADFGFEALVDARERLISAGLSPVGAGSDLGEANLPVIVERGGWTIAVVSFSGVSGLSYSGAFPKTEELINPWFATEDTPGVAPASFANMEAVVSTLDPLVDFVFVSLHQGEFNETRVPTDLERRRAEALVAAGADAVIAHHHHRLLPIEYFQGRPIFWGMGNFVWKALGPDHDRTAVAEIVIEADGTVLGRLVPATIVGHGQPALHGTPDYLVRSDRTLIR